MASTPTSEVIGQEYQESSSVPTPALHKFLAPLKAAILSSFDKCSTPATTPTPVSLSLLQDLLHFIWDANLIYIEPAFLFRTYASLSTTIFNRSGASSDWSDMLDYKPIEFLALKAAQLFILLILPNPPKFTKELENLTGFLQDPRISIDSAVESGFSWLQAVIASLYATLSDQQLKDILPGAQTPVPWSDLTAAAQAVVHGASVIFIKLFRTKAVEKVKRLERLLATDEGRSVEWALILGEVLRLRRRESGSRNKWAGQEEMALLDQVLNSDGENPFVRLATLDTIIGVVRDSSGRFRCGGIILEGREEAMRYLIENCGKLTQDFSNNVHILSQVSDYFARYFPHLYFDADKALNLLEKAYELNPSNPKTTHRFGILYRMSYGDCDKSLKWLKKTVELDPTHYQATMEYYKTLLGKGVEVYDVPGMMEATYNDSNVAAAGWNDGDRSDFLFYLGIAYFIRGNKEKTLEWWRKAAEFGESIFTLEDMLTTSENFQWDHKVVDIDKIKLWIQAEKKVAGAEDSGFLSRLFSIMLGFITPKRPRGRDAWEKRVPDEVSSFFVVEP